MKHLREKINTIGLIVVLIVVIISLITMNHLWIYGIPLLWIISFPVIISFGYSFYLQLNKPEDKNIHIFCWRGKLY